MSKDKITVDSFNFRIPIRDVTIKDESLFGTRYIVEPTSGNIEDEFKKNREAIRLTGGITVSMAIQKQTTSEQRLREYLVILVNAKLLKESYFDGITLENAEQIYNEIIALGKVSFSYTSFLQAECTDVDFKLDRHHSEFHRIMKKMRSHAKSSVHVNRGMSYFDKKDNRGIEFGKRNTATASYPYLKLYAKQLELMNKSGAFYSKHLSHEANYIDNLIRTEFTIKNKSHFRKYDIEDTTLASILSIGQDKLKDILKQILSVHLEKRISPIKTINEMKANDRLLYNAIYVLMEQNQMNYNLIRETLIQGFDRQERYRKREKMDFIYESFIKDTDIDKNAEALNEWFDAIGWE